MSNKVLSILRIVALAIFLLVIIGGGVRFFSASDKEITTEKDEPLVLEIDDKIERIIVLDDRDEALMNGTILPKILYDAPSTGDNLLKDFNEVDFVDIYDQAKRGDDVRRQLIILQDVYTKTGNPELLPYLVNLALQVRDYTAALSYVDVLEERGTLFSVLDPTTIFSLLFNGLELDSEDIAHIKDLVLSYEKEVSVAPEQIILWNALITYAKGDMDNYTYFMSQLSGTVYDQWNREYTASVTATKAYTDVPVYYLDVLTALQVFSHGWYQVARVATERSIVVDELYMLPRQIHGYASMMLSDWVPLIADMQWLRDKDKDNEQLYTFLAGVAHMELEQYPEAVLLLREIRGGQFFIDAQRYLLLAYEELGEYDAIELILEYLLVDNDFLPHDFYTIFDLFFYKPLRQGDDVFLYATHFELAERYIDACYDRLGQEYAYICLRGKSGLMIANGEGDKAYRYLQRLVKRYPKDFLYTTLGDLAYEQGLYTEAKKRFSYSLATTEDITMKESLMNKIRSVVALGK